MEDKKPEKSTEDSAHIHIDGNVGAGSAIGGGTVHAQNIAGRDIHLGTDTKDVVDAFLRIYQAVDDKQFVSEGQASNVREAVELIEEENAKGEKANEKVVKLSFQTLAQMAPDILDVVVATLVSPITGISAVVKKIAEKAKSASENKS